MDGFFCTLKINKFDATHSVMNERMGFFILNIMETLRQLIKESRIEN